MDTFRADDRFTVTSSGLIVPKAGVISGGEFHFRAFNRQRKLLWEAVAKNAVVNQGLNHMANVELGATAKISAWYIGLVDASGFSAFAAADTHASHAGWTESTAYDEAARQTWGAGTSTAQSITAASPCSFTGSTNGTNIHGAFLASLSTKGSASGAAFLFATGAFDADRDFDDGTTLQVNYVCNFSST